MTKLLIVKKFTDRITGEHYNVNDVKEFEDARANELLADSRTLVLEVEAPVEEEIEEPKKPKSKAKKK